jgi:GST-like protein
MQTLADFSITRKWPPQHPDRLQLYSLPTPNGQKVGVLLEECGLPYEAHSISFGSGDQRSAEFLGTFPNGKIPALIDPAGPGGKPLALFESGAILVYLADRSGRFLAREGAARYAALQWLMWQMGGVGPMFGQVGFFHRYAGKEFEDKRPRDRYVAESRRLLQVLDAHLARRAWLLGDEYTIADIAVFPWVHCLLVFYEAGALVGFEDFRHVQRVLGAFLERPAVVRGMKVATGP